MRIASFGRSYLGPLISSRCTVRRALRVFFASGCRAVVPSWGWWGPIPRVLQMGFGPNGENRFMLAFFPAAPPKRKGGA